MTDLLEKLMTSPLPIDRVSQRVVKKAKPEEIWQPLPCLPAEHVQPGQVLRTVPIPKGTPKAMLDIIGTRRGRLRLIGYAADQGGGSHGARWVVRCDCGNYEHRVRILRWAGTKADDMCRECAKRFYVFKGYQPALPKAERIVIGKPHK